MPHKGPGMRTPRTRALEIGAATAGFEGAPDASTFSAQAGVPVGMTGGKYVHIDAPLYRDAPSKSKKAPFKGLK